MELPFLSAMKTLAIVLSYLRKRKGDFSKLETLGVTADTWGAFNVSDIKYLTENKSRFSFN